MNKVIVFISFVAAIVFINWGMTTKTQVDEINSKAAQLRTKNLEIKYKINEKASLTKQPPVLLGTEYSVVLNQIRLLESYSGTVMNVQLEGSMDTPDITSHYEDTEYQGIRGLKIRIVVDKFSKETDMGAVLDDIHLLEKNSDFIASEISKDNNNLIVKGEVYGL